MRGRKRVCHLLTRALLPIAPNQDTVSTCVEACVDVPAPSHTGTVTQRHDPKVFLAPFKPLHPVPPESEGLREGPRESSEASPPDLQGGL